MVERKAHDETGRDAGPDESGTRDDDWQEFKDDVQDSLRAWTRSFVKAKEEFVKGFQEVRKKD
jgi:hypothetical protein